MSADGLYYRIKIETNSNFKFLVIVFVRLEDDYAEIIGYEQINLVYDELGSIDLAEI